MDVDMEEHTQSISAGYACGRFIRVPTSLSVIADSESSAEGNNAVRLIPEHGRRIFLTLQSFLITSSRCCRTFAGSYAAGSTMKICRPSFSHPNWDYQRIRVAEVNYQGGKKGLDE